MNIDQWLLPFAEREYVDVNRAASILGIAPRRVLELIEAGAIDAVDYAPRKRKRVRYKSLVDFCDALRQKYCIRDRRVPLSAPYLRHRDGDLLPFPIEDTIHADQVAEILGYDSLTSVYRRIEEGCFEAYQILPFPPSPWRISKISLAAYLDSVRSRPSADPLAPPFSRCSHS